MEMLKENIDFDKVLMSMTPEEIATLEDKTKNYKQKSLDRRVAELENWRNQTKVELNILRSDNKELKENNEKLSMQIGELQEETKKVTKTLLTHGTEKRKLENYINIIIYNELKKNTIRDELFHGCLTSNCKKHISKSLCSSSFNWIEVEDVDNAKKIAMKFLNKATIHSLMRKEATRLNEQHKKSKKDNKKSTIGMARKFELLELLIDEVGGDINEI